MYIEYVTIQLTSYNPVCWFDAQTVKKFAVKYILIHTRTIQFLDFFSINPYIRTFVNSYKNSCMRGLINFMVKSSFTSLCNIISWWQGIKSKVFIILHLLQLKLNACGWSVNMYLYKWNYNYLNIIAGVYIMQNTMVSGGEGVISAGEKFKN